MDIRNIKEFVNDSLENDLHKDFGKEKFFSLLKKSEIDLIELASIKKKHSFENFHNLNFIIKSLYEDNVLDIVDIVIFIEEDYFPFKDVLGCLNEENIYYLKLSLLKKNNKKSLNNSLKKFL